MPHVYDRIGVTYGATRRPDPRIAALIGRMLPMDMSVLNVGAGAGSYEPPGTRAAVDPSRTMLAQRSRTAAPAVRAVAEALPFRTRSFDAVLAVLTLHHWTSVARGLADCMRVARDRIVVLTWDPDAPRFWLVDEYFPELDAAARTLFPSISSLEQLLGPLQVVPVPIPGDCQDGFLGAYWKRPEAYLDPTVRAGISAFALVRDVHEPLARLRHDVQTGEWERRHAALHTLQELDLGYRLLVANVQQRELSIRA